MNAFKSDPLHAPTGPNVSNTNTTYDIETINLTSNSGKYGRLKNRKGEWMDVKSVRDLIINFRLLEEGKIEITKRIVASYTEPPLWTIHDDEDKVQYMQEKKEHYRACDKESIRNGKQMLRDLAKPKNELVTNSN